jgi:hypothetical protein
MNEIRSRWVMVAGVSLAVITVIVAIAFAVLAIRDLQ